MEIAANLMHSFTVFLAVTLVSMRICSMTVTSPAKTTRHLRENQLSQHPALQRDTDPRSEAAKPGMHIQASSIRARDAAAEENKQNTGKNASVSS